MKVDFSSITIHDINGKEGKADLRRDLGNLMYMQGQDISECELGQAIFHQADTDPLELDAQEVATVMRMADMFPYVVRTAIKRACGEKI